jgi:hypothetical protein
MARGSEASVADENLLRGLSKGLAVLKTPARRDDALAPTGN